MSLSILKYSYNLLPIIGLILNLYILYVEQSSPDPNYVKLSLLTLMLIIILLSFMYITKLLMLPLFSLKIINADDLGQVLKRAEKSISNERNILKDARISYMDIMVPVGTYTLKNISKHIPNVCINWRTGKPNIWESIVWKKKWLLKIVKTLPMSTGHTALPIRIKDQIYFGACEAYDSKGIRYVPEIVENYKSWADRLPSNIQKRINHDYRIYERDANNKVGSILCIPLMQSDTVLNIVFQEINIWQCQDGGKYSSTLLSDVDSRQIRDGLAHWIEYIDYVCLKYRRRQYATD